MSAIHELIAQISDHRLRERLSAEWANAAKERKFGLVFEHHLPELLPLHGAKPRKGDLVCRRQGALKDVWPIKSIHAGIATCVKPSNETHSSEPTGAVESVVASLHNAEDVPPAETGSSRNLVVLKRRDGCESIFAALDELITCRVNAARAQSPLRRYMAISRRLTIDEIDDDA